MQTVDMLQQFELTVEIYLNSWKNYTMEQINQKPSEEEWSLGQMYNHLIMIANTFQLKAIELCAQGGGEVKEKTEAGENVFAAGAFPPVKIKLPPLPELTPPPVTDKDEVSRRMLQLVDDMKAIQPKLLHIPAENKVQHPRFGALNAVEWYQLGVMHFKHHLRQKQSLEEFLGIN